MLLRHDFTHEGSADSSSHRCPDCYRFARKIAGHCYSSCEEEAVAITVVECADGEELHDLHNLDNACHSLVTILDCLWSGGRTITGTG